ncbi:MAG: hypothetical protein ACD_51C00120G0001 [uncultured bacterium]|nr:MAG: hypothetical protein ACD_51C00120G0001 [uncultured bacterium]KKT01730.1 MAG: hypothetical protein UV80_C0009G0020 [Candidatus Peregrinibacteria bacterium GW2011_GWF2_43_17]KKT20645.1 MAG: hypothetical protein UW03_C0001G0015 [Candidatus Peregrinibacteria bacterium GW2011_GWA2_43_8]HAU39334.1 hypothetical protein [Candidatus Peregrinibacteria bacterium]
MATKKDDTNTKWLKKNVATKRDLKPISEELTDHRIRLDGIEKHMATKQDLTRIYDRLDNHEIRLDRIEENMATKHDLVRIYETLDKVVEIGTRNSQENAMMARIIERLDSKVEEHDDAIRQMKPRLGMA